MNGPKLSRVEREKVIEPKLFKGLCHTHTAKKQLLRCIYRSRLRMRFRIAFGFQSYNVFFHRHILLTKVSTWKMQCKGKDRFTHAISTSWRMCFQFRIGIFQMKTFACAFLHVHFYLVYQKQPWFGTAGSDNSCVFHIWKRCVATRL